MSKTSKTEKALFAAGCFWGVQYYFDQIPGVIKTTAGYAGGHTDNPTYEDVLSHTTGHAEAIMVEFNPGKVRYSTLVKHFFRMHNPTALNAADGINIGDNYRSALYYFSKDQKDQAEEVIAEVQKQYDQPIVTEVKAADVFYPAEAYHQKFTERTGRGACHISYAPFPEEVEKITE